MIMTPPLFFTSTTFLCCRFHLPYSTLARADNAAVNKTATRPTAVRDPALVGLPDPVPVVPPFVVVLATVPVETVLALPERAANPIAEGLYLYTE
jgi:hypothetical protein